jgi:hypothetical protein
MARAARRTKASLIKHPENAAEAVTAEEYEELFDLPEETKEQRKEKRRLIKAATRQRNSYGKVMKPCLWAQRHVLLRDAYENLSDFTVGYTEARARLDGKAAEEKRKADLAAQRRKAEAQARRVLKSRTR